MLSESQIEQYKKDGYVVPDFTMPEYMIIRIEESHNKLLSKHPEFKNYCPAILSYDESFLKFCSESLGMNLFSMETGILLVKAPPYRRII